MRSLVVYESMYGNTHQVAEAIGEGLKQHGEVTVVPTSEATREALSGLDLLVVGGPTHVHGMSRASTRQSAADQIEEPDSDLELDPDAAGDGVREWLEGLDDLGTAVGNAAAFDTRVDMSAVLTGRASKAIAKRLRHHRCHLVASPESFLVTRGTHLEPGEKDRARAWGQQIGKAVADATQ